MSASYPTTLACADVALARLTLRNTGTSTWTRADGYKLGAVDDADPFHLEEPRIWLAEDVRVEPGAEHTFEIELTAPATAGPQLSDWQMVQEGVEWFGTVSAGTIEVVCNGGRRPLPDGFAIVEAVAAERPDLLAASCQDQGGTWEFLDLVVDRLRETDTRWGYNWKRGVVGDASQDAVDYHWGDGVAEGSTDVYIVDVIGGHCGDSPRPIWLDQTEATAAGGTIGRWTGRGRF